MSNPYRPGRPFKYNAIKDEGKAPFNVVGEYRIIMTIGMVRGGSSTTITGTI